MPTTVAAIIGTKAVETVETKQYTSDGCKTIVDKFDVYNSTAGALTITVRIVTVGGTAGPTNTLMSRSILAGGTDRCGEIVGHTIEAGGFISTLGSSAGLVLRASGRQVTSS